MPQVLEEVPTAKQAAKLARELAEQVGTTVDTPQVQAMARVARTRHADVLGFLEDFLTVAGAKGTRREALVAGLSEALKAVAQAPAEDPLRSVDEPQPTSDAASSVALAEAQATENRRAVLRECVNAEEAARLTRRSRQSLERFRRAGRVLALREGNQWLYPRWQLAPDAPGGVVSGLRDVMTRLGLSPAGVAYWLTRSHGRLGAAPIRLLQGGQLERVLAAAREHGERV